MQKEVCCDRAGWGLVKGSACWESGAEFPRGRSTSDAAVGPGVGSGFVWGEV